MNALSTTGSNHNFYVEYYQTFDSVKPEDPEE